MCTMPWRSRQQKQKSYALHRIEILHIGLKVYVNSLEDVGTRDELNNDVKDGEEHDQEIVSHEGDGGPVTFEEHGPSAELERFTMKAPVVDDRW